MVVQNFYERLVGFYGINSLDRFKIKFLKKIRICYEKNLWYLEVLKIRKYRQNACNRTFVKILRGFGKRNNRILTSRFVVFKIIDFKNKLIENYGYIFILKAWI